MKHSNSEMTIVEAVETLTSIAELDPIKEKEIREDLLIEGEHIGNRRVDWLASGEDGKETVQLVKSSFKAVLKYLKTKWRDTDPTLMDSSSLEGIKTIMLLVGEAAKRLNHFNNLFASYGGSSYNLEEYRQLQDFYLRKIDPTISEEILGKWVLGIGRLPFPKLVAQESKRTLEVNTQHLYVDMDAVRTDSEYELFFIRKADGSRFFNPRLIKSMKLVSEFGFLPRKVIEPVPYIDVDEYLDVAVHQGAKRLIKLLGANLDFFYMDRKRFKEKELVSRLSNMFLSLFLCSHSKYLKSNAPLKCCLDFFEDFLHFFRDVLNSYDYQKLISYPPSEQNRLGRLLINIINTVSHALHTELTGIMEGSAIIERLIAQGSGLQGRSPIMGENAFIDTIVQDHKDLSTALKRYSNNPLTKVLDRLENESFVGFDPWIQGNLPSALGKLEGGKKDIHILRLPSPTRQEYIQNPELNLEFKTFIENLGKDQKLLLLNFQNRTSWKEHDRSKMLEELDQRPTFNEKVEVVTFEIDTEFYDQLYPYDTYNDASKFKETFKSHIREKQSGYFFSSKIEDGLFPLFVDETIEEVHKLFFEKKNVLTIEERRAFIDIVHLFIEWKLLDLMEPKFVAFCCKDGVDTSPLQFALLYYAQSLFGERYLGSKEREYFDTLLFAPALLIREREVNIEKFDRLIYAMRTIEGAQSHLGVKNFGKALRKAFDRMFHSSAFEYYHKE